MLEYFKDLIPKDFIESNHNYLLSRVECYEIWFEPDLIDFLESDKELNSFLINDCTKMKELAKQNLTYAKNYLEYMKEAHRGGQLIHPGFDIDSQVDYLTESDQEFVEEALAVKERLNELFIMLSFFP